MSEGKPVLVVVGGSLSGLQAALEAARSGKEVVLVEESAFLGGLSLKSETLEVGGLPALCMVSGMINRALSHPKIKILTNSRIEKVSQGNGKLTVRVSQSPSRVTAKCNSCGDCLLVCPIKPYDRFNEGLVARTAIDFYGPRSFGGAYDIEKETPACQERCPVHIDIRRYVCLIAAGRYEEAIKVIRDRNPLPAICGRICPHPCESVCNRGRVDEPIAIDALKRFVSEYEIAMRRAGKMQKPTPKRDLRKKVAVVGSGPAGLTVAHDLALEGFNVTIFEAAPVAGGMMHLGIPEYRLPREILTSDIEFITDLGVEIKLNMPLTKEFTVDDLLKQGYKAVFIGVGAYCGLKLNIPGEEDYEGIVDCIEFLRRVNLGDKRKPGNKVIVIGGGNSAIDSARVALRLGCEEVTILYRRSRKEMPANPWEVEAAENEGVRIHYLAAPIKILGSNGRVTGMLCTRMKLGKPDASGRRAPVPIEGSEFEIDADLVIPAISQKPDLSFLPENHGFKISKWESFVVDEATMATNREGVYAGGDAVTGPATVVEAIRGGHIAADAMKDYLMR
ncbi:MAG: FAD-dependent oxidoreductase [bacterium]